MFHAVLPSEYISVTLQITHSSFVSGVGVFLVGKEEGLFRESFRVTSYFTTIEGLRAGAAIRLAGVDVGIVDKITITPEKNKVRVDLKLRNKVQSFIRKDSFAAIEQELSLIHI